MVVNMIAFIYEDILLHLNSIDLHMMYTYLVKVHYKSCTYCGNLNKEG